MAFIVFFVYPCSLALYNEHIVCAVCAPDVKILEWRKRDESDFIYHKLDNLASRLRLWQIGTNRCLHRHERNIFSRPIYPKIKKKRRNETNTILFTFLSHQVVHKFAASSNYHSPPPCVKSKSLNWIYKCSVCMLHKMVWIFCSKKKIILVKKKFFLSIYLHASACLVFKFVMLIRINESELSIEYYTNLILKLKSIALMKWETLACVTRVAQH